MFSLQHSVLLKKFCLHSAGYIKSWPWTAAITEEDACRFSDIVSNIKPPPTEGLMLFIFTAQGFQGSNCQAFFLSMLILLQRPALFIYAHCSCHPSHNSNVRMYVHSTHTAPAVEKHSFQDWQLIFYLLHTSIRSCDSACLSNFHESNRDKTTKWNKCSSHSVLEERWKKTFLKVLHGARQLSQ